uniref:Putative 18.3 kDa subfamily protein of the basic tail superfamily n=1 Tax=Amblyomma cajennense TaxID=34607 RepID=A0A023FDY4_AMBCJ
MANITASILCVLAGVIGSCCAARPAYSPWHHCRGQYIPPGPKSPCAYRCYSRITGWSHGTLGDGAPCTLSKGRHAAGQCIRGVCIEISPPWYTTCDGVYRGRGYAPSCRYTCRDRFGQRKRKNYFYGTPCLNTDKLGNPFGAAGICKNGHCIEHDDLVAHTGATRKVFSTKYHRCQLKTQLTKDFLSDCHHYCQKSGAWYYGLYKDYSRCQLPDTRIRGVCCRGLCRPGKRCSGAE